MSLSDQLKAYYKLDESSGNAVDSSGNGANLTNNGTTTFAAALQNNGADFGATNSSKYFKANGYVVSDGALSISCWVKLQTEITTGNYVFAIANAQSTALALIYEYNGGSPRLNLRRQMNNVAGQNVYKTVTLGTSNWYHLVGTYDGSYITLYVDNVAETPIASSGTGTGYWNPGGGHIGLAVDINANNGSVGSYASCYMDEVSFYQRALTPSEVETLYNSGLAIQYPFLNTFSLSCDSGEFTIDAGNGRVFTSTITNETRQVNGSGTLNLLIGGGYKLLISPLQHLLISPFGFVQSNKPTASITNSARTSSTITNENKL